MISFGMFERSCCFKQCGYRNLMLQLWSADRQQQTQNITQTMPTPNLGEDNFWREVPKRKCLFLQPACCHQEWIVGIISPLTSMILLQAAVQFSGCPYTVIAFSSAAECSSFLRLVSIKSWSGSVAAVFGHYLMVVVMTKLQGFYLCTSTLARDCCVIALDYKLGKAKKSL